MCGRDRTKKGVRWPLVLVPTTRPFCTNQGCAAEWVRRAFKAWLRPNLWLHQLHGLCVRPRSSRSGSATCSRDETPGQAAAERPGGLGGILPLVVFGSPRQTYRLANLGVRDDA